MSNMLLGFTSSTILSTFRTGCREHIASSFFDKKTPLRASLLYTALAPASHFHGRMYMRFRLMYASCFFMTTIERSLGPRTNRGRKLAPPRPEREVLLCTILP